MQNCLFVVGAGGYFFFFFYEIFDPGFELRPPLFGMEWKKALFFMGIYRS